MRFIIDSAEFASCIHAVQQRQPPVKLVYTSCSRWPLPSPPQRRSTTEGTATKPDLGQGADRVRVSVLDSSFNPPTKAHLALALSGSGASIEGIHKDASSSSSDAHLLLLSVRNADKALKAGDASHEQRLEMMVLLAKELESKLRSGLSSHSRDGAGSITTEDIEGLGEANVAVGIIDEPTFVRKSAVLREFLNNRLASYSSSPSISPPPSPLPSQTNYSVTPSVQLTFQMGTDTLVRLLDPRYYGPLPSQPESAAHDERKSFMHSALNTFFSDPPDGDGARVTCARRSASSFSVVPGKEWMGVVEGNGEDAEEKEFRALGGSFYDEGKIKLFSIGEFETTLSSSDVRKAIVNGVDWEHTVPAGIAEYIKSKALYLS